MVVYLSLKTSGGVGGRSLLICPVADQEDVEELKNPGILEFRDPKSHIHVYSQEQPKRPLGLP